MRFVGPLHLTVVAAIVGFLMYNLVCEGWMSAVLATLWGVVIVVGYFYMTAKVSRLVFKFLATKFPDTFALADEEK